ncbi:heme-binding domain-containing protein [Roseivirga sp. E12]|uniref:heme-binding domain-containing protein n=1 Tax=Roseivirga sp. E12 TaxID=2819237 RepID=UPI001ABCFA83|nr:heme-binding domain-containing protein [Roseivirga sp. E12]MBO3700633.1 heme-binding domain-containing protein [Roseivirga sp. E12]
MKKALKYVLGALIVTAIVIQFINRPERVNEPVTDNDIIQVLEIDGPMANMLKSACYDCHSDQPRYPWYASIAPVSWRIAEHIEHGRDELNFSKWGTYSARRRDHKLEEMIEEVEEGHMPLPNYVRMHGEAKLSDEQIESLKAWVNTERENIASESTEANN